MTDMLEQATTTVNSRPKIGIIDADVHPQSSRGSPACLTHLPPQWRDYVRDNGLHREAGSGGERPRHREYAHRWDTVTPDGHAPGSNPQFTAERLRDPYGI